MEIGAAITLVVNTVLRHIDLANLAMLYLLGVIFAGTCLGRGPSALLPFLFVAAFDFFFPPRLTFALSDSQYLVTFALMLLTSLTISHLTSSLRHQVRLASLRDRCTAAMYAGDP